MENGTNSMTVNIPWKIISNWKKSSTENLKKKNQKSKPIFTTQHEIHNKKKFVSFYTRFTN